MYIILYVPTDVSAKDFINEKLLEDLFFYSLYAELVKDNIVQCATYTLPVGTTLNDFIDTLESANWKIIKVTFYQEEQQ